MKRIGKTDQGGIILEMTAEDLNRFQQVMDALADLLVQGANHGLCVAVADVMPPPPAKVVTLKPAKGGDKKSARTPATNRVTAALSFRDCEVCGKQFPPMRSDSKHCSASCRGKAYRRSKGKKPSKITPVAAPSKPVMPTKPTAAATGTKVCEECKAAYKPTSNVQKFCEPCGKARRLALLKKLHNKVATPPSFADRGAPSRNLDDFQEFRNANRLAREEV